MAILYIILLFPSRVYFFINIIELIFVLNYIIYLRFDFAFEPSLMLIISNGSRVIIIDVQPWTVPIGHLVYRFYLQGVCGTKSD